MMAPATKNLYALLVGMAAIVCMWLMAIHYFWGTGSVPVRLYDGTSLGRRREASDISSVEERSLPLIPPPLQSGYVVTVSYNGQQSAGVRSMISQACWVGTSHLPMKILEPFFVDSFVESIPTEAVQNQAKYMSDYYDIDHFKNALRRLGYAQLTSWENFIENAPRNVIYVRTQNAVIWNLEHMEPVKVLWDAEEKSNCYRPMADDKLNYLLEKHDFCIVRVLKIFPTTIVAFTEEETQVVFNGWRPESVTLIFEKWLGAWHIAPTFNSTSVCENAHERTLKGNLLPSQKLVGDAIEYERKFSNDGNPFKVAVMLRSEHIMRNMEPTTMRENLQHCLSEVTEVTKKLQLYSGSTQAFLTSDIGRYGSTAFNTVRFQTFNLGRKEAFAMVHDTVVSLFGKKMTFTQWENTFEEATGGVTDRGYIASLQRTLASRADCIVLVGGGQFPKLGLLQYMENHRNQTFDEWCIHLVCIVGRHTEEYDELLRLAKESSEKDI